MNFFQKKIAGLSSTKRSVVKNVYWALLGKIVNLVSALFVGILVARYLGPEQCGLMNYVISFVSLFAVLANFGLDNIEIRELSRKDVSKEVLIGTAFRLKLFFAAITICIIALLVFLFETDAFTKWMILIYSLSIVLGSFNVIRNYFTSIVQNEYVVKTEISRTVIGALLKIVLLLMNASLAWFIVASTFDFLLIAGGYVYSYTHRVGLIRQWKFDRNVAYYLMKQSFPLLLSGAAVIIYQRIDQVMIGNMLDKSEVGYFSTAGKFTDLILFLPIVMSQTITPILVRTKERSEAEYAAKKQTFVNVVVWVSVLISIGVSLLAYWLVLYTFGQAYLPAVPVLQIMAFKSVGMALSSSSGQLIIIEKIHKWAFIRNGVGCFICIGLNLLLIPHYGITGSAVATVITVAFAGCLANVFIPPYYPMMRLQLRAIFCGWKDLIRVKEVFK